MSILNRYVLKQFIKPFVASFFALCLLIFVSQIFDRLDRFMAEGVSFKHVIGFLLTSMPFQALQILPVACLLATLFVVGNLSRTREYIASLAGGLPPERFLGGILLAGFVISCTALVANETIIPPTTHYARTVFREKIRRLGDWRSTVFENLFVAGADGRMWAIKAFNPSTGTMNRLVVDTSSNGRIVEQIDAKTAEHTKDGWMFKDGVVRTFSTDKQLVDNIEPFLGKEYAFKEQPDDFVVQEPQPEEMTYARLKRHVKQLSSLGVPIRSLEVELIMKLSFPFACFVVVFLGVPLALQGKGSRAIGIAAAGILTLIYLGFMQFGKALAQRLVPAWCGAWLGNFVFVLVGCYLWVRMRRSA